MVNAGIPEDIATKLNPNGIKIEFKSWKPGSFSLLKGDQYKSQLKAYIKSGDFEQIFDAKKLAKEGIENPDNFVKQKIVEMIKNNAEEFWSDTELKNLLKKRKVNRIDDLDVNHPFIKHFKAQ